MSNAVHGCAPGLFINNQPVYFCGGTYVCPGCEREVGYCLGCWDDMPELCDDCWDEVTKKREEAANDDLR